MKLAEYLQQSNVIVLDGAMGTQLAVRGLEMGGQNCLSKPEHVVAVHQDYLQAGSNLLITNTLTMNRAYIETHGLDIDVKAVNLAGATLAKQAINNGARSASRSASPRYVLGDISSTGQLLQPYGDMSEDAAYESFKEQAAYLAEGGVDGFIIETMISLQETLCALRACKDAAADLPVIASVSFATTKRGGRTTMGDAAEKIAQALTEAGASVIGSNCGDLTPLEMAEVVATLKGATSLPIVAQPNAGKPRLEGDQTIFDMGPQEFAHGVSACIAAGATLVGGCCGTSPEHIKAIANTL